MLTTAPKRHHELVALLKRCLDYKDDAGPLALIIKCPTLIRTPPSVVKRAIGQMLISNGPEAARAAAEADPARLMRSDPPGAGRRTAA